MTNPPPPPGPSYNPYADPAAGPAPISPADEKQWSILTHVLSIFFGFIPALVIYLMFKDRGPFIRNHALTEWNFQLTLLIVSGVAFLLAFGSVAVSVVSASSSGPPLTLGLVFVAYFLLFAVRIVGTILQIIAAVKASRGEFYTFPLAFRFVK